MECGTCTLCCKLLEIKSMKSPAGIHCEKCILGKGCSIYGEHPQECKDYRCAYHQMEKCSIDLRPDNSHVIFEKLTDNIFIGLFDPDFPISEIAKKQIRSFNEQGFSVSLSGIGNDIPIIFPCEDVKAETVFKEAKLALTKHGSSKLHI